MRCTASLQDPLKRKQLKYYLKKKSKNQVKHHKGNETTKRTRETSKS